MATVRITVIMFDKFKVRLRAHLYLSNKYFQQKCKQ